MLRDKILVWRFNRGSRDALRSIYERFKDDLLGLAVALLKDKNAGEDVVHDVFVSFAQTAGRFELKGSLKGYLSVCAANAARDRNRRRLGRDERLYDADDVGLAGDEPVNVAVRNEEAMRLNVLLAELAFEQREVVVLHLHHGMKFRQIAELQDESINTVQSRYRYGLDKLRSLLNGEVEK